MLLYHLSSDDQCQESKCMLQEIHRMLFLPGVWRENLLSLVYSSNYEGNLWHIIWECFCKFHKTSPQEALQILVPFSRYVLYAFLSLQGTVLTGGREGQETLSFSQGAYCSVAQITASWEGIWAAYINLYSFYVLPQVWIIWNFKNFFCQVLINIHSL